MSAGRIVGRGFLVAVLCFMVAPILIVVLDSFNTSSYGAWPPPGFDTRWYANLLNQDEFGSAALVSLELGLASMALAMVAGTLAAVAIARSRLRATAAVRAFLMSPLVVPKIAIGLAAFVLFLKFHLYGSLVGVWLVHTVLLLPFVITIVGSALVRANFTLEEAARDLGAGPVRAFFSAMVPQIERGLVAAAVLAFVISFDEVDATVMMVSPKSPTLPIAMYVYIEKFSDPTMAALSTILIAVALVLAAIVGISLSGARQRDVLG